MFVHYYGKAVNSNEITSVDYSNLVDEGFILVYRNGLPADKVEGPQAFNVVMTLCPDALEGEGDKYQRHAWAVHNLIGHPLMQICAWLHLTPLGLKIHDLTVPNPITNKIS